MLFTYEASDKQGTVVKGDLEAANKRAVVEYLQAKELVPVTIIDRAAEVSTGVLAGSLFETVTAQDQILLIRNLGASIKAGLALVESLEILIADTTKRLMQTILTQAKVNLENGLPLSQTFRSYPKYFPAVFVGLLRAGEASGQLERSLDELGHHLSREYNLSRRIRSALAYPVLLIVASIGVVVLLLVFVLPRLTKAFKQTGSDLPFVTRMLVVASNILTYSWIIDALAVAALIWFFVFFRQTQRGRRLFLGIGMRVPVVRELIKKIALVRFARTLGGLVGGGISIVEALTLTAESVGNHYYEEPILRAAEEIKSGVPLSKTFGAYPQLFPRFLVSLVGVGERTGTLETILKNLADFYDEEVDTSLKDLTNFIEPILLLVMGVVIGAIALAILLPIYRLVGTVH